MCYYRFRKPIQICDLADEAPSFNRVVLRIDIGEHIVACDSREDSANPVSIKMLAREVCCFWTECAYPL